MWGFGWVSKHSIFVKPHPNFFGIGAIEEEMLKGFPNLHTQTTSSNNEASSLFQLIINGNLVHHESPSNHEL